MKIHKQILEITEEQIIEIPSDHFILSVQNQDDNICIWYQFDYPNKGKKKIVIRGTGIDFDNEGFYIGTVIIRGYVWHIYDFGWIEIRESNK